MQGIRMKVATFSRALVFLMEYQGQVRSSLIFGFASTFFLLGRE